MPRARRRQWPAQRLVWFAAVLLASFAALAALWGPVVPTYNRLVALVAAPVFRVVESNNVTVLEARGDELWVNRRDPAGILEPFSYFDSYVYFGLVPLLALLIAIPWGGWAKRLRRILAGLALLFLVHVTYVVGSVEMTYAAVGLGGFPASGRLLDWAQILLRIVWQASPVLIALGLAVGVGRKLLRGSRKEAWAGSKETDKEKASRSAAC